MSADEVREIAAGFRERGIPCDVLYLDIDYMDGYRVFTWDRERFPDPAGLIAALGERGLPGRDDRRPGREGRRPPTTSIVEGRERGYFCLTRDGDEYRNVVWPGLCAFPDFTRPGGARVVGRPPLAAARRGRRGRVVRHERAGAVRARRQSTMPRRRRPSRRRPAAAARARSTTPTGSLMAQAAREGLARLRPERRPFVISRAGYAGLQRHALQWTGDNSSWWEHLWMSMPQLQNLGLSGIAWAGVDVGGFFGDCDGELLARWTEFGDLPAVLPQPLGNGHGRRRSRGRSASRGRRICRDMLRLRMRLLPYLYTAVRGVPSRTGAPILRPLLFELPRRPGHLHGRRPVPARRRPCWSRRSRGRDRAPARVPARRRLGALVVGRGRRGPGARPRPRAAGAARRLRAGQHADPAWPTRISTVSRSSGLTWRVFAGRAAPASAALYEDAGDGYGPSARRTAHVERGDDGLVRLSLSERAGDFVPSPRARRRSSSSAASVDRGRGDRGAGGDRTRD